MELTSYCQVEEFRKGQKEEGVQLIICAATLPENFVLESILSERCACHQEIS